MMRLLRLALCLGLLIVAAQSAQGWNTSGHMVSGAIAYDVLEKQSPETLAKVLEILKQHPDFEKRWAKRLEKIDPDLQDRAIFMLAARWPDDVRGSMYDHPQWHYIDFPYVPPGQPDTIKGVDPPDPNILIGYRTNVDVLKDPKASAADKAVALCWIMHLTGDIHQPLHATGMYTTDYPPPTGDQGATKIMIRVKPDSSPITLHKFWDDLILGSDSFQDVKNRAIEIRTEFPRDKLPELADHVEPSDIQKWAEESFEEAKKTVYREGAVQGNPDREKAPALPSDYIATTKPVAEHRMADAGYRMADVLATIMQSASAPDSATTTDNEPAPTSGQPAAPDGKQSAPGEKSKSN